MSAPSLDDVLEGIAVRCRTITGLNVQDVWAGQATTPAAIVGVPPIDEYLVSMQRGVMQFRPTITVVTSSAMGQNGQRRLAEYASPTGARSIPAAIWADKTLAGLVASCHVESFRLMGLDEIGATSVFAGVLTLFVACEGA